MVNNILIIGITGNGKSALANTLVGASASNEFGEGSASTSVTKNFKKSEVFEWKGKSYHIIDNIGFEDNKISVDEILLEVGEGIYSAKEGINQVLFVFKGRFSPEQIKVFNLFKNFIFESEITNFTTLVRTNFPNFREPQDCEDDRNDLIKENKKIIEIIKSCKGGIIYVDNPSTVIEEDSDDSDDEREKKTKRAERNEKKRKESRRILLDHLAENCSGSYKIKNWDNMYSIVAKYVEEKERIERSNSSTNEEELNKLRGETIKNIRVRLEKEFPEFIKVLASIEQYTNTQK